MHIGTARTLPQYQLTDACAEKKHVHHTSGNWTQLVCRLTFRRQVGHFLLHLYAPSAIIVSLSWITFFIPKESVISRTGLGFSAVLTVLAITEAQNQLMPKVPYFKFTDWYLMVCFVFVSGVLVEYTLVLCFESGENKNRGNTLVSRDIPYGSWKGLTHHLPTKDRYLWFRQAQVADNRMDGCSRVLFPICFVTFNLVYWVYFFGKMMK